MTAVANRMPGLKVKSKVIQLTDEQVEQLSEHYAQVTAEHANGRTGMLLAQVGHMKDGGDNFMRVGFIENEVSKTISAKLRNGETTLVYDLLAAAIKAEAVLARGGWLDTSPDPEAVALRDLRAAIERATQP